MGHGEPGPGRTTGDAEVDSKPRAACSLTTCNGVSSSLPQPTARETWKCSGHGCDENDRAGGKADFCKLLGPRGMAETVGNLQLLCFFPAASGSPLLSASPWAAEALASDRHLGEMRGWELITDTLLF